ncbi:hypothetical protein GBN32_10135 [Plesiomonas shigelloides]|uniref:PD-(D/E)XK nuclease-like domain-containing protein n=1 Tax=Plesiomonas shigelloides TaxID=703 RepID=UPI0012626ACF|nr:PD-(D/E)XK nuclease-like domain-containing protein [Plesiomonas shigelloides]KAB7710967.1 hypothetical protein GBN32_10135 [Plesiomonas shigelloides]
MTDEVMSAPAPADNAEVTFFEPAESGFYQNIPATAYHGGAGLSKSALDWALISGQHYHYYQVEGNDQKTTAALREGRILHKIVLEFDNFNNEFAVEPAWPEEAISSTDQMKAIIQEYNDSLEVKPPIEELIAAIEARNDKLIKPLNAGKTIADHEIAYDSLPDNFRTLGEDDKRTATALKACIKRYNDTLPKPLKTSGGYQAVLDSYAMLGAKEAERVAHINALPQPLPVSGTKAEMVERIRSFKPDAIFLDDLKEAFLKEAGEREIVTAAEYQHALRYREAIFAHPEAAVLLELDGEAETSIYWNHPQTGELLKCRPDWMSRKEHVLADLKFVRNASPSGFARDGSAHNYHIQAAHYSNGYETLTGHVPGFVFIAVEKDGPLGKDVFKPILVGVYYYSIADRERGLELRDMAVRNVVRWRQADYYPGHDGVIEISVPTYQIAAEERKLLNDEGINPPANDETQAIEPLEDDTLSLPENLFD